MGLDYIPHQGRSFLGVTKSFVTSGARSNKQTNKVTVNKTATEQGWWKALK